MKLMLLLALLQAPQDTARFVFPVPRVEAVRDTTVVEVNVYTDSLAAALQRGTDAARAAAINDCGCVVESGAPGWFYPALTTLLSAAVLRYWLNSRADEENPEVEEEPAKPEYPKHRKHPHG